jgi:hypothetical protein
VVVPRVKGPYLAESDGRHWFGTGTMTRSSESSVRHGNGPTDTIVEVLCSINAFLGWRSPAAGLAEAPRRPRREARKTPSRAEARVAINNPESPIFVIRALPLRNWMFEVGVATLQSV